MSDKKIIPGYHLTLGITMFFVSLFLFIPLAAFLLYSAGMGLEKFLQAATDYRNVHAYLLSFGCAFAAAVINCVFGLILAWVLVRYDFKGKRIMDAMIDLPFALPTAIAGIALTTLYAENGWVGQFFYAIGIPSAFSPMGITIALIFVGIPFVARSVQPVLKELDPQLEEAAQLFGADNLTIFRRVILPELVSPLMTGFALAFSRGIGEYGSVVFIAGNMPFETEIAPLMIMTKLEQFDYQSAAAIAIVMMVLSLAILLSIHSWQSHKLRSIGAIN
ncbi:MAG: sulfate ABC transporter permease subunit CysT [Selenomonadaceae bacterium]|nr:sulfate ABC transporter permease subunit CysT [Selenomonadaceae bacterium]MBR1579008.1 sulfate ABC transporter permease subunit CysT [Selenomonadaceae bacterium]